METLYKGIGGEYYYGESAWNYVTERTGINLKAILQRIADQNTASDE
ncbi:ApaLI family restriction endonuclease [Planktothrix agardhii]